MTCDADKKGVNMSLINIYTHIMRNDETLKYERLVIFIIEVKMQLYNDINSKFWYESIIRCNFFVDE